MKVTLCGVFPVPPQRSLPVRVIRNCRVGGSHMLKDPRLLLHVPPGLLLLQIGYLSPQGSSYIGGGQRWDPPLRLTPHRDHDRTQFPHPGGPAGVVLGGIRLVLLLVICPIGLPHGGLSYVSLIWFGDLSDRRPKIIPPGVSGYI